MSGFLEQNDSQIISAQLEKSLSQHRMEELPEIKIRRGLDDTNAAVVSRFGRISRHFPNGNNILEN